MNIASSLVEKIERFTTSYSMALYDVLSRDAASIFHALICIWALYQIVICGVLHGNLKFPDFIKKIMVFAFVSVCLSHHQIFQELIANPFAEFVDFFLVSVLQVGLGGEVIAENRNGMLVTIDEMTSVVIDIFNALLKGSSIMMPHICIGAILLVFPYLTLLGIFTSYVLEYIFKLTVVTAIFPVLFICLAFNSTRSACFGGIKVVLQGALNLIFAVIAMGFVLFIVRDLLGDLPALEGIELKEAASNWVFGGDYFASVIFGGIACLFLVKTPMIAASIIGATGGASHGGSVGSISCKSTGIDVMGASTSKN